MFGSSKFRKYEKNLIELIAIALNKNSFDELEKLIFKGKSIDHIKPETTQGFGYIEKILTEEIEKQFGDPNRPFIELILNAIDAKSSDYIGDYDITVLTKFNEFIVSDNGKSMSLRQVLSNFIIPFYSEKTTIEDIGRFGVGFLSNLSFCLEEPRLIYVKVNICTGSDAFRIMFYSESENVKDMMVSIERVEPLRIGTDVIITRDINKASGLLDYLKKFLDYFNPLNARIKINKSYINLDIKGETFIKKYPFKKGEKELEQVLRITLDTAPYEDEEYYLKMYSQGVFIYRRKIGFGNIRIDLPSAVDVVEGRDEFKLDEAYFSAVDNIWCLILDCVKTAKDDGAAINDYRELLPALEEGLNAKIGYQDEFIKYLFPRKTYVVDTKSEISKDRDFKLISDFFGKRIFDSLYQPKSENAFKRWREILGTSKSLIDEFSSTLSQGFLADCLRYIENKNLKMYNASFLKEKAYYRLVKISIEGGISAFLRVGEIIYINIDSRFFSRQNDFISEFNNIIYYKRALGLGEKQIGREFV